MGSEGVVMGGVTGGGNGVPEGDGVVPVYDISWGFLEF